MRKRIWITCTVVLAGCLLLLLFKATRQQETALPEGREAKTNRQYSLSQAIQSQTVEPAQNTNAPTRSSDLIAEMENRRTLSESNELRARQARAVAHWQAPIEFYGKVVDENSNAVSGVNIHFRWIEAPAEGGEKTADTQSGSDGLFSLHGKIGRSLTVWFGKEGYYASHGGQMGFLYALGLGIHSPDPQNPVIFKLRKKGQGAELTTSDNGIRPSVAVRVPKNNTPVRVDFFQRKASATGQVEISQNKPPWKEATEWSLRLSIPDGGFVKNQDEFQFEAPETKYEPTVEYQFTKGETNWTTQVSKQFYIAFGQPRKYGWLRIESNLAQETIFLTYAINPTGSRNLEAAQ